MIAIAMSLALLASAETEQQIAERHFMALMEFGGSYALQQSLLHQCRDYFPANARADLRARALNIEGLNDQHRSELSPLLDAMATQAMSSPLITGEVNQTSCSKMAELADANFDERLPRFHAAVIFLIEAKAAHQAMPST